MLYNENNMEALSKLDSNSVDSVVTDPPYGLSFMNKKWDHDVPSIEFWKEVLRVLKPGGHVLSFGGTRTYHRMAVNIEDAGFEIRDQIMWLYGSGFPKSHNISKALDKKLGAERSVTSVGEIKTNQPGEFDRRCSSTRERRDVAVTNLAKQWDGFGTALKPANEPIVLARKPLSEKTIVDNVLKWGCGGLNIDGCRVGMSDEDRKEVQAKANKKTTTNNIVKGFGNNTATHGDWSMSKGRFPANIILDEEAGRLLDEQSGDCKTGSFKRKARTETTVGPTGFKTGPRTEAPLHKASAGGASRFFYCAKASKRERNAGLEGMVEKQSGALNMRNDAHSIKNSMNTKPSQNHHPTVKPIKLMEYLTRLITPPGGTVLDPFMGSGTTGIAAKNEGFNFIGMEMSEEYFEIAKNRIEQ